MNFGVAFAPNEKPRFSLGLEAFLVRRFTAPLYGSYYGYEAVTAAGPLVQFNLFAGDGWRATLGATGGWSPGNAQHAVMGELGATYRFKHKDWGLRVGALYEPTIATFAARHDFFINETTLSAGFRFPGTFGAPLSDYFENPWAPTPGRPLRTEDNEYRRRSRNLAVDLGDKWADLAQDEFEAVFAFGNLAVELMLIGAPDDLIDRALDSAEQEVAHAQFCATQAKKRDDSFELQTPRDMFRIPLTGVEGLARLALEGLVDGYRGEGLSAQTIRAGVMTATEKELSHALSRISHEETGHADLGSAIAAWALKTDPTGIVRERQYRFLERGRVG